MITLMVLKNGERFFGEIVPQDCSSPFVIFSPQRRDTCIIMGHEDILYLVSKMSSGFLDELAPLVYDWEQEKSKYKNKESVGS